MARSNKHLEQAILEHDDPLGVRRRSHARFDAALHVAYLTRDNTPTVAFTKNLSQGGMLLQDAEGLVVNTEVDFVVTLDDGEMPLEVRGEVLAIMGHGARVCFLHDQAVSERLRRFIAAQVVPQLEEEVAGALPDLHAVVELANLYADQNQYAAAIGLLRRQLYKRPRQLAVYEQAARLVCTHIVMVGEAGDAELQELASFIQKGHALGSSSILDAAARTLDDFHARRRAASSEAAMQTTVAPQISTANEASEKRESLLTQRAASLAQREADLTARHMQLKSWEAALQARVQALDARESTLHTRNIALQTAAAELDSRNASIDTANTAHAVRQAAFDARERTLSHASDALEKRQQELIEQSGQLAARRALIEERERVIAQFNTQLQSRQETVAAREQALEEATRTLRREQEEHAARRDASSRALEEMRLNYTHSMQDILQRVRAFSAALRVKLTARQRDMAAAHKQVAQLAADMAKREQVLAAYARQLEQDRAALDEREVEVAKRPTQPETQQRLTQLNALLQQAENDIALRDQALQQMKQALNEARAQLEQRNRQLAAATEERITGQVESSAPKRTDDVRKQAVKTAPKEYRSSEYDVINMEEMKQEETHAASNENPLAPAPRWRIR